MLFEKHFKYAETFVGWTGVSECSEFESQFNTLSWVGESTFSGVLPWEVRSYPNKLIR